MEKKILIIDDSVSFQKQIESILENEGYTVLTACSGEDGLLLIQKQRPDLLLLELELPKISGFEVCRILRESESNNLMPIIILTGKDALEDKLNGLELGADDYITKPFNERELLSRIRNTLRRIDGNRAANPLTGLCGNLAIEREINERNARGGLSAFIYIDLDNFKAYNDVYGFAQGDIFIKKTADILIDQISAFGNKDDFLGHIGGDDFLIITTPDKAPVICENSIREFDKNMKCLFHTDDYNRGSIITFNRRGEKEIFPLTSISMGIVTNEGYAFTTHLQVSAIASELKKKLKLLPGSNYMVDKRSAPGFTPDSSRNFQNKD